ncbi:hypothetical protein ABEY24_10165 [Peribacillus frigoritolerans]|uniref:hypothetical protein n=1 Tax=Peribacillus frigoritolerans TaxID=450367 RepID=UPI003D2D3286
MRERQYLLSYIEDNDLGVYSKQILVQGNSFPSAYNEYIKKYPTMFGLVEMFGKIEPKWVDYYSHESQDLLRRSQLQTEITINEVFKD